MTAPSSRAGTTTAIGGRDVDALILGIGRGRQSRNQPASHPTAYSAGERNKGPVLTTGGASRTPAGVEVTIDRYRARRAGPRAPRPPPGQHLRAPAPHRATASAGAGASHGGDQRGGARRSAHAAADRHAGAWPRQLLRARGW